ncbi:MAG: CbiX/SirB N-terminal domain-containing protein [Burkholderiaceae bacterium]|nr:CbiX/SirB N-terminal domain-containing protein [Burkholderiaceae bacterium]
MPSPPEPVRGLLLFAHGARDPQWARPFEAVAERCRSVRGRDRVALAFLEFMAPDLVGAGQALVDAGCTMVDVVPLFLGAGGHVRKDIPALMARLQSSNPQVGFTLRRTVGEAPALIEAMAAVALDATAPEVAVR